MKSSKVYVDVNVEFDTDGHMYPRSLIWEDGEKYDIDRVKSVRPAFAARAGGQGDRYTVIVSGKETHLYFEHNPDCVSQNIGKWFVERR